MKIEDLLDKTPDAFKPLVAQYGPALVAMTADEFARWLTMLIAGKTFAAWQAIMAKLGPQALLVEGGDIADEWAATASKNADRMDLQRNAAMATMKVLLAIFVAAAGF